LGVIRYASAILMVLYYFTSHDIPDADDVNGNSFLYNYLLLLIFYPIKKFPNIFFPAQLGTIVHYSCGATGYSELN
jgi:hypothetical protein